MNNIKLNKEQAGHLSSFEEKQKLSKQPFSYSELIKFMKELRAFFHKEYPTTFKLGNIYQGSPDFSYFSLTTAELKIQKLKFVIILNHQLMNFSICLSGQNKSVRKQYWEMFKRSNWNKYHLVESINNSLIIVDHILVDQPDFNNRIHLTKQIEEASLLFINDLSAILEN